MDKLSLGIDLGGTRVKHVVVTPNGETLLTDAVDSPCRFTLMVEWERYQMKIQTIG